VSARKDKKNGCLRRGNEKADLIFVGEAPGEEEDMQGVRRGSRKLLDQIDPDDTPVAQGCLHRNALACRLRRTDPDPSGIDMCKNYLFAQLEIIKPKVICALGRHAYNTLMGVDARITKIRGQITEYNGIPLLPTYHPSFLLRNQDRMKEALEDMEKLREILKSG
jgi:DNA polymerase